MAIWSIERDVNFAVLPWEIVVAMLLSVPVAFTAAACVQHKVITRIVTSKYGDENLYTYFMNGRDTEWIYVRDKENNLTYEGRVSSCENEHIHEFVLLDCTVYRYEDSAKLYSVPTAYLSREIGKLVVEAVTEDRLREE